jgi:hypothetical protein
VLCQPRPSRCSHHGQLPGRCHGKLGQRRGGSGALSGIVLAAPSAAMMGAIVHGIHGHPLTVPRGSLVIGTGNKLQGGHWGRSKQAGDGSGRQAGAGWQCTGKDRNWQVLAAMVLQLIGNGKRGVLLSHI